MSTIRLTEIKKGDSIQVDKPNNLITDFKNNKVEGDNVRIEGIDRRNIQHGAVVDTFFSYHAVDHLDYIYHNPPHGILRPVQHSSFMNTSPSDPRVQIQYSSPFVPAEDNSSLVVHCSFSYHLEGLWAQNISQAPIVVFALGYAIGNAWNTGHPFSVIPSTVRKVSHRAYNLTIPAPTNQHVFPTSVPSDYQVPIDGSLSISVRFPHTIGGSGSSKLPATSAGWDRVRFYLLADIEQATSPVNNQVWIEFDNIQFFLRRYKK